MSAVKNIAIAEKKIKDLDTKLAEADRERKSAEAALAGAEKQAEDQLYHLRKAEEQLQLLRRGLKLSKKSWRRRRRLLPRPSNLVVILG